MVWKFNIHKNSQINSNSITTIVEIRILFVLITVRKFNYYDEYYYYGINSSSRLHNCHWFGINYKYLQLLHYE